ncbi:MAG: hypothetical protein GWP35_04200 [Proteobacteria bacterium]|nr:hypothetical protein [Pseudomonadota bacterium]
MEQPTGINGRQRTLSSEKSSRVQFRLLSFFFVSLFMLSSLVLSGCGGLGNTKVSEDDEIHAVEIAKLVTRNKKAVERLIQEVMETVDADDESSILTNIGKYKEAALLMDEAVKVTPSSMEPRLIRFEVRKRIADGYTVLYAYADEECTPLEDEGLKPSDELLRKRAEAKVNAERWLKLARRDMETHLGTSSVQFQRPDQYWALQVIYVQLGDYINARMSLLRLLETHGTRIEAGFRRDIDSRIRYFQQRIIDEEG